MIEYLKTQCCKSIYVDEKDKAGETQVDLS